MIKQQYLLQQIVPSVFIKCEVIFNSSSKWLFLITLVNTRTQASSAFVALKLLIIVHSLAEEEELEEAHPLLKSLFVTYTISTLLHS